MISALSIYFKSNAISDKTIEIVFSRTELSYTRNANFKLNPIKLLYNVRVVLSVEFKI